MDTAAAVRRWIDGWTRGWSAHDAEPIAALYAPGAVFVSHPFRDPQAPLAYAEWAFSDEDGAEFRFGEPVERQVQSIFQKLRLPDSEEANRRVLAVLALLGR